MKLKRAYLLAPALLGLLASCDDLWPPPSYQVVLPRIPAAWTEVLGDPDWRLEWIGPEGTRERLVVRGYDAPRIPILETWATPVTAYPFWDHAPPETMKPAGALFPFDVAEDRILLSWEGGVDAALYRELARAGGGNGTGTPRHPQYFNWPRFREVLAEGREGSEPDLWRMDWPLIAEKTARSGFDRRRLTVAEREPVSLPLGYAGFWVSASPFAEPVYQDDGADLALNLCDAIETYVSSMGILRCSKTAWVLTPRSRQ